MYWVTDPIEGLSSTVGLQTPTGGGWVVIVGVWVVLAGSGVIAWRRRHGSTAKSPAKESAEPTPVAEAVLTDEERVHRLLESNEGRMRQARIVEETEWSKSKVSMLLSEMEAEGSITKLRIGRENIISHPGFEPDATRSTLESRT
ncbi:helix-turn-helix domain-containing protein [Halalkalicoccus sp. NIPERK01]|uniref:helix-turn-helix transcriptional regulator n=1 Tax=Halalkalicoccus sp. NIPERK01 TaxID=3053469 RepID=UPI00256EA616|nr:helix-turn-helix domain-containing protein [Halalkalicoccus sp. NIPERK01]MDL5360963.1 hypothetical protein [Halalkalicoccus sp. NIPERK01]